MSSLIMSGAYVGNELRKEFGRIPPALLPAGGGPLVKLQADLEFLSRPRHLLLPFDYELTSAEREIIRDQGLEELRVDPTTSVEQAIIDLPPLGGDEPTELLFGDTMVDPHDLDVSDGDVVFLAEAPDRYTWAFLTSDEPVEFRTLAAEDQPPDDDTTARVACGALRVSDLPLLQRLLSSTGDLAAALSDYASSVPLRLVDAPSWIDFGHYDTYFAARRALLVARAHNSLRVDAATLTKQSADSLKMEAEQAWFSNLPVDLSELVPRFYGPEVSPCEGAGESGYRLEYLPIPVVSEIWTYGRSNVRHWIRVFSAVLATLDRLRAVEPTGELDAGWVSDETWHRKVRERVQSVSRADPGLADLEIGGDRWDIVDLGERLLDRYPATRATDLGLVHGDFFFGNLLHESRSGRVFLLDPRGLVGTLVTNEGDRRYDLAKLAMSVWFGYDSVIEGQTTIAPDGSLRRDRSDYESMTKKMFSDYHDERGISLQETLTGAALLMLSLLPFHFDSPLRQRALFATTVETILQENIL